jgi:hypothetical protein
LHRCAIYTDRELGFTKALIAACSTAQFFTGNNVYASSDLASRALTARLEAYRVEMENRTFMHPDPLGWTRANRGKILQALFGIMLGNPELAKPFGNTNTRFKMFQRVIGSALEYAAECSKGLINGATEISFKDMFLAQEDSDDDTVGLVDLLCIQNRRWPNKVQAVDIVTFLIQHRHYQPGDASYEDAAVIRNFLFPGLKDGTQPSARWLGSRLSAYKDTPVRLGDDVLTLRMETDKHNTRIGSGLRRSRSLKGLRRVDQ